MLSYQSLQELKWWKTCFHEWNGKPMILPPPELTITSDASTQGWGHIPTNCKQGEVGNDQTRVSYKLSRTSGSVFGLENLRQGQTPLSHHVKAGQYYSASLHKAQGWDTHEKPVRLGNKDVEVVSEPVHHDDSLSCPGQGQRNSGFSTTESSGC